MVLTDVDETKWIESSKAHQADYARNINDRIWDNFEIPAHDVYLFKKIGIALYGLPTVEADDLGLKPEQRTHVEQIKAKCIEYSLSKNSVQLCVLFIYVLVRKKQQIIVPLFRVRSIDSVKLEDTCMNVFVDHNGRVYKTWQLFLDGNNWDESKLCLPLNGYYRLLEDPELYIVDQSTQGKVLSAIDTASSVVSITSTVGIIGGTILCFTPLAPFGVTALMASTAIGVPSAMYGTGRSVGKLVDRKLHDESIGLGDSEARMCWLNTAGCVASIATLGSTQLLASSARAGNLVSSGTRAVCTGVNVAAVAVTGLGIANTVYDIKKKGTITTSDVVQLSASIFFFTHSVATFKTASTIIKNTQSQVISGMREPLAPRNQNKFDAIRQGFVENAAAAGKGGEMRGQAVFIKEMKNVNPNSFYRNFRLQNDGQFVINNEVTMDPKSYTSLSIADRTNLLNLSDKLRTNKISVTQFNQGVTSLNVDMTVNRQTPVDTINAAFQTSGVNTVNVGNIPLNNLTSMDKEVLSRAYVYGANEDPEVLSIATAVAEEQKVTNAAEFGAIIEFVGRKVNKLIKDHVNVQNVAGVIVQIDQIRRKVIEQLSQREETNKLSSQFTELRQNASPSHTASSSISAANDLDKESQMPQVSVGCPFSSEYYLIAAEMSGEMPIDPQWTRDGSTQACTFFSPAKGHVFINFEQLEDGKHVIVTLCTEEECVSRLYDVSAFQQGNSYLFSGPTVVEAYPPLPPDPPTAG